MKDFKPTSYNLETRLNGKGPLDLKAFWQYIEEKYFKLPENIYVDVISHISQLINKQAELPFVEKKDSKEFANLIKNMEESYQIALYLKEVYKPKTAEPNIMGLPVYINQLGRSDNILSNIINQHHKYKNSDSKIIYHYVDPIKANNSKSNNNINSNPTISNNNRLNKKIKSNSLSKNDKANNKKDKHINNKAKENDNNNANSDEILDEIKEINRILETEFNNNLICKTIENKLKEELILNNSQKNMLLKNIRNQIVSLELAQYAESVTKIELSKKVKDCFKLSCDVSDKLPALKLNEKMYRYLFKFRDSSNFLFSLDKSHSMSHIFINEKRKSSKNKSSHKELAEKKIILKKEDINIDFNLCHNCKIRKPTELMLQCKNKDSQRSTKSIQIFNLNLIRKQEKHFIVPNYTGEIRDLIQMLHVKHLPLISEKINQKCGKYFCNYCLKGSYQLNVESLSQGSALTVQKTHKNHLSSTNIPQNPNSNIVTNTKAYNSKSSKMNLIKDWCCPWCSNDCFCSRCIREEQIFKLIGTYFQYEGDLFNLYEKIINENPIIGALKEDLIISNLEILDLAYMERHCKNNTKNLSFNNYSHSSNNNKNKKVVVLSKKGKFEKYNGKKKANNDNVPFNKSSYNLKALDKKNLDILDSMISEYDNILKQIDEIKTDYQLLQRNICERVGEVGDLITFNDVLEGHNCSNTNTDLSLREDKSKINNKFSSLTTTNKKKSKVVLSKHKKSLAKKVNDDGKIDKSTKPLKNAKKAKLEKIIKKAKEYNNAKIANNAKKNKLKNLKFNESTNDSDLEILETISSSHF